MCLQIKTLNLFMINYKIMFPFIYIQNLNIIELFFKLTAEEIINKSYHFRGISVL